MPKDYTVQTGEGANQSLLLCTVYMLTNRWSSAILRHFFYEISILLRSTPLLCPKETFPQSSMPKWRSRYPKSRYCPSLEYSRKINWNKLTFILFASLISKRKKVTNHISSDEEKSVKYSRKEKSLGLLCENLIRHFAINDESKVDIHIDTVR